MNYKILLSFAIGVISGVAGGVLATRSHYKKKYEKELSFAEDEMRAYYEGTDEYARKPTEEKKEPEDQNAAMSEEDKETLKNYKSEKVEMVPYHEMYSIKEDDDETPEDVAVRLSNEEHQKNKDKPPRIITAEEAGDLPAGWREEPLYYYMENHIMTDDFDEIVDDPAYLVGNCLTKYGFINESSDEDAIFVKNYALQIVYWIQKIEGSFPSDAE